MADVYRTKLSALRLNVGDTLDMEYDYGAGWEFSIELMSVTEMKRGTGTHYPYVTDGKGKGILEDTSPYELLEAIKHTDQTGEVPRALEIFSGKEKEWGSEVLTWNFAMYSLKIIFTYAEIEKIAGLTIDHSFLTYKKDLLEYGYKVGKISMKEQTVAFEKIS